ncbi:MAG: type I-E CRISPR-associated protein Cas7/Cse4/CasC [Clostridiales bacterium]|nr:type I-E CRISPR-associated protein Cas7/Cse4/CasC [Clostridiales bacterium]
MKTEKRLFVDVHVLQTVPPSCVNRDDTGSPKTAVYGGVVRARVSSQCWKRAMRIMFNDLLPSELLSLRTKRIVSMVAEEIKKLDSSVDSEKLAQKILEGSGLKIKSVDKGTDALFFLSIAQAKALAKLALEDSLPPKKVISEELRKQPGIDIALFGRMVADDPSLNTDACAQVAHSISTHKVDNEYDYFTAVDDLAPEDNAGAGHIGTVEFNSSTLYRYATVAVHELYSQIGDDAVEAMRAFVQAFVLSMPTGKQNTFANRTLPDAVMIAFRDDQPINLVGAFEKPVLPGEEGYVSESVKRLSSHAISTYQRYACAPKKSITNCEMLAGLGELNALDASLDVVRDEVQKFIEGGEDRQ